MSLLIILPNEILKLIQEHLRATIIQCIFKLNRPLTKFEKGDRVLILDKRIYGTLVKINETYSKIKLLPRIIPNWKRCNINFWQHSKDYSFPYYIPKSISVSNDKIIKLNDWNYNVNIIDRSKRLSFFQNESDIDTKTSNMFKYYF